MQKLTESQTRAQERFADSISAHFKAIVGEYICEITSINENEFFLVEIRENQDADGGDEIKRGVFVECTQVESLEQATEILSTLVNSTIYQ